MTPWLARRDDCHTHRISLATHAHLRQLRCGNKSLFFWFCSFSNRSLSAFLGAPTSIIVFLPMHSSIGGWREFGIVCLFWHAALPFSPQLFFSACLGFFFKFPLFFARLLGSRFAANHPSSNLTHEPRTADGGRRTSAIWSCHGMTSNRATDYSD